MPATGTKQHSEHIKSIRLTADGFSFYDGREVVLVATRSTFIPMEHFSADKVTAIYNKVYAPAGQPSVVHYNILPMLEVVELWSVPKDVDDELRREYPRHRWLGVDGLVMERVAVYDRQQSGRRLYVYSHDGEMLVFCFKDGWLHYCNSFWPAPDNYDEEARYFIFGVWRALQLDAGKDECLLIGDQTLLPLLSPYMRHVGELSPDALHLTCRKGVPFDILCI